MINGETAMSNSTASLLDANGVPLHGATHPAKVLDSTGQAMQPAPAPTDLLSELTDVVRQRPLAAVLVGIGFGILLGRLTA